MKELQLTVFEPGDMLGTMSKDGKVAVWTVGPTGDLVPSDNRMFASGLNLDDPIEALNLTVRTYNVLKREGVHTIEQMADLYDKGYEVMFEIRNLGEKGVAEIGDHVRRLRGEEGERQ
jgi:DNA-directed RNA polymerase alpha subunit